MAARRAGVALTALGMQVLGVAILAALLLALGRWPVFTAAQVPWAFALALIGTLSLVALYRAFALGPIAVVSPVVASYAALSVVGIVVFVGERLTAGQTAAIAITFVGVILASADVRELRRVFGGSGQGAPGGALPPGVRIGIVATIGFGVWGTVLAAATRVNEPFALVILWRIFGIAMVALFVLARRVRLAPLAVPATAGTVALVGVLDTGANVLLMLGVQSGFASFVLTGSGAYPIIPAVLAILVLRERLAPNQYLGVAVLIAGLVALGVQS